MHVLPIRKEFIKLSKLVCQRCGKKTKKLPYINLSKLPTGWTWGLNGALCSNCSHDYKEHPFIGDDVIVPDSNGSEKAKE